MAKKEKKFRIAWAIKHAGALHRMLKVAAWEKIPAKKFAIKASDTPLMKKRKNLAKTLDSFHKKKSSLYI